MNAELRVVDGPSTGTTIDLPLGNLIIGRENDCHFRPDSELISRHHCVIKHDAYTVRVRDMDSKNGTFINGRRIRGEAVLSNGDTLVVGDLTLQFSVLESTQPASDPEPVGQATPDEAQSHTEISISQTAAIVGPAPAVPPHHFQPAEAPIPTPVVANQPQAPSPNSGSSDGHS